MLQVWDVLPSRVCGAIPLFRRNYLKERAELRRQFDNLKSCLDTNSGMEQTDRYTTMALDVVVFPAVRRA